MPQEQHTPLSGNESAASLAFATQLQDQMMGASGAPGAGGQTPAEPGQSPGIPQGPQPEGQQPQQSGDVQTELKGMEDRLMKEIDSIKKDSPMQEIKAIKEELNTLLDEQGQD